MNDELTELVISPDTRMDWVLADTWCHPVYLVSWRPLPLKPVYVRVNLALN